MLVITKECEHHLPLTFTRGQLRNNLPLELMYLRLTYLSADKVKSESVPRASSRWMNVPIFSHLASPNILAPLAGRSVLDRPIRCEIVIVH